MPFVWGTNVTGGCDETRRAFFELGKSLESLPPTTHALELGMSRANYQAKVWLQADRCHMSLGSPADSGGLEETTGVLKTVWTRKPSVPESCLELVKCALVMLMHFCSSGSKRISVVDHFLKKLKNDPI